MLSRHLELTDSAKAKKILDNWTEAKNNFWCLSPKPELNANEEENSFLAQEAALSSIGLESGRYN